MEEKLKVSLLKHIGKVYDTAQNSKLKDGLFKKLKSELKYLSAYFKVSDIQVLFIAVVLTKNATEETLSIFDLSDFFDCNSARVLEFSDDFDYLYEKNIFQKPSTLERSKISYFNYLFSLNTKVIQAIFNNTALPVLVSDKPKTILDVLETLYYTGKQRHNMVISTQILLNEVQKIIIDNLNYPLIKRLYNLELKTQDTFLLVYVIWKAINGEESVDLRNIAKCIFDEKNDVFFYVQEVIAGKNTLIERKLLETVPADFFDDTHIKLSDNAINILKEEGMMLFGKINCQNNIIKSTAIMCKELVFNPIEMQQLDMLRSLLDNNKMNEIQKQLRDKLLPAGITAMFYGCPGTGKTESVYQLARKTGRELVKVDISQSKSMWFGESEKIIKRVFTDYKSLMQDTELLPILLFNEADAIFSSRKEVGISNVAQTENTIQNIILEELDNFDGILIATTNLVHNLDSAFERRFLFKIEFNKPALHEKALIWKIKMPELENSTCHQLAEQFDFTGGQIDNIVRKAEIQKIVYGSAYTSNDMIRFCNEEKWQKPIYKKIGFIN